MTTSHQAVAEDEERLLHAIRQHAQLTERAYRAAERWTYRTSFHLLLALGRRFTPAPRPPELPKMPDRLCYSNAARYARAHSDRLVYAEGFALTHSGLDVHLPHAWCVRRNDGTVLDPTWDAPGQAYIGIPVADQQRWPVDGGGLLTDVDRLWPLLREGFPQGAIADVGRPLT